MMVVGPGTSVGAEPLLCRRRRTGGVREEVRVAEGAGAWRTRLDHARIDMAAADFLPVGLGPTARRLLGIVIIYSGEGADRVRMVGALFRGALQRGAGP